jgi:type I restriction enzyme S subunit
MDSTNLQPPGNYPPEWQTMPFDGFTTLKRGKDLTRGQFREGTVPVASSNGRMGFHNTANVKAPGVTVGRSGSVGRVTFYAEDFWAHNTALFVTDFHGNDERFAAYFLHSLKLNRFGSGVSVPTLDRNVFRDLPVTIPPLPDQRKIAGVLGLVERAMEQQERLLAVTAELKKTLLHQLFTAGLRGEPQKQTDIGPLPQSWEVKPLGDYLTEAQYGLSVKGAETGRYAVLRMTNQQQGCISAEKLQYVELTPQEFEKFRVARQDILFNRTNSLELVGRTAIFKLDGDFVFASYLIRLRTDADRLRPHFLNHYFNSEETQVRLKSIATRAVSQSNISATRLRGFPIPVPSPREQDEIVAKIDCLNRKLLLHRRKHVALTALFRTLLHELMTARIRVHNLDLPELETVLERGQPCPRVESEEAIHANKAVRAPETARAR